MTILTILSIVVVVPFAIGSLTWSILSRKANDPLEELLNNVIENGHLPEDPDNSYCRFLKKRNIDSVEELNRHLESRIQLLEGKQDILNNDKKMMIMTPIVCLLITVVVLVALIMGKVTVTVFVMTVIFSVTGSIFMKALYDYHCKVEEVIRHYFSRQYQE
jgi:hypothetical protein